MHGKHRSPFAPSTRWLGSVPALALGLAAVTAGAQSYQGGIRGQLTDAAGAALPHVSVKLIDQATKLARTAETNGSGEYVFVAVEPATYTLTVVQPGFTGYEQKNLVVSTQQFETVDVKLSVGASTETVEVEGSTPLLDTTTASNGQTIDTQMLEDLPNLGRNPYLFAKLSTNVAPSGDPRFNRFQDQTGSSAISIAGGPVRTNNYLIDGVPVTDLNNRAVIIPSIEATQEMKLQVNTYDAEIARTGGGVFNTVLKSGTGTFHGTLYGETRQTNWAAHNYFYTAGAPYSATYYTYAGAVGGPVIIPKILKKGSTFFWVAEEGYRQRSPLSAKYYVPTTPERSGNFAGDIGPGSANGSTCPTGATCLADPLFGTPAGIANGSTRYFANNVIPANRINPIGQALINLYPVVDTAAIPTGLSYTPTTNEAYNTSGTDLLGDRADEFDAKLDHQFFPWWYANASYLHYGSKEPGGNPLHSAPGASSSYLLYRKVDAFNQNNTFTLNPTTILTVAYGFNRFPNNTVDLSNGYDIQNLGFSSAFANALPKKAIPAVLPQNASQNGTNNSGPAVFYSRSALASIAKSVGNHSLKAGYDFRTVSVDFTDISYSNGLLYFDTGYTGFDLANLLLGYPTSNSTNNTYFTVPTRLRLNLHYNAGYVQDSWRIGSKLTFNYGLRYEYEPGIYERDNQLVVGFNRTVPNPTAIYPNNVGGVEFAGTNGYPSSCCDFSNKKFAPRAGFAYEARTGTVIRGGFGIFYPPPYYAASSSLAIGYTATNTFGYITPASAAGAAAPLSNLFPNGLMQPTGNSLGYATGVGSNINELDQGRRYAQLQQYSFDIQQEFAYGFVFKAGYVGSHGKNLQASTTSGTTGYNINQVPDGYLTQYTAAQLNGTCGALGANAPGQCAGLVPSGQTAPTLGRALRPFQAFNNVTDLGSPSRSNYNSLIARLEKSTSHGFSFLADFTWASAWDSVFGTASTINPGNTAAQDAYNINNGEYARSTTNIPLRFTTAISYALPFGRGRTFANNKWLDLAIGGWNINTVGIKQSGSPMALSMNSNGLSAINAAVQRPSYAPGFTPFTVGSGGRTENRLGGTTGKPAYLAPSGFVSPNAGSPYLNFGNVERTIPALSPGLDTWDVSIFKEKKLERVTLQFRAEALNVLNTPQFAAPNLRVGNSSFGAVTSQVNLPRYIQMGGRINF